METSTLPIEEKEQRARHAGEEGSTLLDCPLSGTGAQARTKDLVVYRERRARRVRRRSRPFMTGFSRAHYYLGEFGNGSKMKFVANLLVAIHNVSAAEAFVLGMKAGPRSEDDLQSDRRRRRQLAHVPGARAADGHGRLRRRDDEGEVGRRT